MSATYVVSLTGWPRAVLSIVRVKAYTAPDNSTEPVPDNAPTRHTPSQTPTLYPKSIFFSLVELGVNLSRFVHSNVSTVSFPFFPVLTNLLLLRALYTKA